MKKIVLIITLTLICFSSFGNTSSTILNEKKRVFIEDTLIINSFLWGGRIIYVRNKDSKIFDTSLSKWAKNISSPEINDGDSFATNYLYHPYFGALYYQVYRDLGYSREDAYIGTIIQSTLWEFSIEGTVEKPSVIDLLVTPGLGIPLGLYFEKLNANLSKSDSKFKRTLSYLVNPTKLFMSEGSLGFVNPMTGSFMIYKPFSYRELGKTNNPLIFNNLSFDTYVFDIKQYRGGGVDILYSLNGNIVNTLGNQILRFKFPWAGAYDGNSKNYKVVDNGFEIGNLQLGLTSILSAKESFTIGSDFGINFPSSGIWGDKKGRLEKLHSNSLILKDVLHDATVLAPKMFIFNSIVDLGVSSEIFLNANDYSNESEEVFIVYEAKLNLYKSKSEKYNLSLDIKLIDKKTERHSNLDGAYSLGFRLIDDLDLSINYIKPFKGDLNRYMNNGVLFKLRVPLF